MYLRWVRKLLKKLFQFISHGVWTVDESKLKGIQRYLVKLTRIIILAVEDFESKKLILQASALTFYTLLSIVPVAAMIFGIAKGFGLEERLNKELMRSFAEQPELLDQLLKFVHRLLDNTQGGLVAGFGFILLIWAVLQVLSNIESSFNSIWQINTPRSWVRKFTDYLSIMLIAPLFIVGSGSASIYISAIITEFAQEWISLGFLKDIIIFSLHLIPYVFSALLFMLVYMVIPNTKVKLKSALVAGIVGGFSFQLFQWGYVEFQVGVSRLNAIYGSFAFFPLFITFLQVSWIIVLIGAEISYSLQNIELHVDERQNFTPNAKQKLVLALASLSLITERFEYERKPITTEELSEALDLPFKTMKEFCNEMEKAGLINAIASSGDEMGMPFQPAVDPEKLTLAYIIEKLDTIKETDKEMKLPANFSFIEKTVESIYAETYKSNHNVRVMDILQDLKRNEAKS